MILIYGSYGYTGRLISRYARERGVEVELAGRNRTKLEKQADILDLPYRCFEVDETSSNLEDVDVVLNCAGPFVDTHQPIVEACIGGGVDYLDITGEIDVFRSVVSQSERATDNDVTLMPGVGFDVVPTDCLALHTSRKIDEVDRLEVWVKPSGKVSRGTALTALQSMSDGWVLRDGVLKKKPLGWRERDIDGYTGVSLPLADLVSGYHTTGVENIDTYLVAPQLQRKLLKASKHLEHLPGNRHLTEVLRTAVDKTFDGPDKIHRETKEAYAWCRATGDDEAVSSLRTPETYKLTKITALESAVRTQAGDIQSGFQTPASVWGADYVTEFDGVERTDL